MDEPQQICPECYRLIPLALVRCPDCGADLASFSAQQYRDKLIAALEHPLSEVRMRAIIALGWRRERAAAEALAACALRHPADVIEGLEVVSSLAKIGVRIELAALSRMHPAHAVRAAASERLMREK